MTGVAIFQSLEATSCGVNTGETGRTQEKENTKTCQWVLSENIYARHLKFKAFPFKNIYTAFSIAAVLVRSLHLKCTASLLMETCTVLFSHNPSAINKSIQFLFFCCFFTWLAWNGGPNTEKLTDVSTCGCICMSQHFDIIFVWYHLSHSATA